MRLYFSLVTMSVCIKHLLNLKKVHQVQEDLEEYLSLICTHNFNLGSLTSY